MKRRQRIDSATAAVKVMAGAAKGELLPPEHNPLPEGALPFWRAIVRGRAREEWEETPALLSTAASLAWTQWQIAQARGYIDGSVPIPDGLRAAAILSQLNEMQRLEMSYLRTLQQHGRGAQGEARDASKRRAAAKAIEDNNPLGDDLLARPNAVN
ncbi:MAG TPA: hypothetical protein VIG90_15570 [Pedomonas sp.]|uniref:hypothetical protein n=1 Tax=Pedomonas sp. TaxID=2976421 RepID=UPI002F42407A